jgi:hypothetical protein
MTPPKRASVLLLTLLPTSSLAACGGVAVATARGDDGAAPATDAGSGIGAVDGSGSAACTFDGGPVAVGLVPASGSFSGPNLAGTLCAGGVVTAVAIFAPGHLVFEAESYMQPEGAIRVTAPANATGASLTVAVGYPASAMCGDVQLCVDLPGPGPDCGDAAAPTTCPPDCELVLDDGMSRCESMLPGNCYSASVGPPCNGTAIGPDLGSFSVDLTSLVPNDSGDGYETAHGTLTATLVGVGGAPGNASLTLTF